MQEWRSAYTVTVPEDQAQGLGPGDTVPVALRPPIYQFDDRDERPKPSWWCHMRTWWSNLVWRLFPHRQERLEAKARQNMIDRTSNAWKSDADE